ncbi:twitching motility protein PilT [Porcincola intestinalis]|uniref:Twitching motility protein PilT n=1 Tax=Porcincola intestinalis TaxID=2606632 RepID=A0A6L5X367_9FIRM|nr:twitching motility protein PilT [Porcincola intestinalis]MDD7059300.1 twitching motility protein PilT [Porcincola intestinalis]MDY5282569.1 twitching motility protein PilT [Porcincola intestinalis]MDY5578800.1 twitching motility protein PilT [Porcincola intestinalis]MSS14781.1 twitching motility protein PilT [Porcincola intestinalis]
MIQFIIGEKGRGKTKVLLEKANNEIKNVSGNVVYLDKSTQHMYELNNKIRLIDMTNFPIKDSDEFLGFICGIISQDHDLEYVYLDSFLKIAKLEEGGDPVPALKELEDISKQFGVHFVVSISLTKQQLPEQYHDAVIAEL